MSRVPSNASPEVQQSFRELWAAVDKVTGSQNIDLGGRRILNAGGAVAPEDVATKADLARLATTATVPDPLVVRQLTVRELAQVLGVLRVPLLTDGSGHHGIVYIDENGNASVHNDGGNCLAYNFDLSYLELGYAMVIAWLNQAGLSSPAVGALRVLQADLTSRGDLELANLNATGHVDAAAFQVSGTFVGVDGTGTQVTVHKGIVTAVSSPGGGTPSTGDDTTLVESTVTLLDYAGTDTATLGNSPNAGDPTKWVRINDNGHARYIPTWG